MTEEQIYKLLRECGMVSKNKELSHTHVRKQVAKIICNMPEDYQKSLISTIRFLLEETNRLEEGS